MNREERDALRKLINEARRQEQNLTIEESESWHGTEYGYCLKKCRCENCTKAASYARRQREKRQFEREPFAKARIRAQNRIRKQMQRAGFPELFKNKNKERWEKFKKRMEEDPEFREKRLREKKEYDKRNRDKINAQRRERWLVDSAYRRKRQTERNERNKKRRVEDAEWRNKQTKKRNERYRKRMESDPEYKEKQLAKRRARYAKRKRECEQSRSEAKVGKSV